MLRKNVCSRLLISIVVLVLFSSNLTPNKKSEKDIHKWFQTYSESVALIEDKAFRKVDFSRFIQDSLKSAVSQIDAHSAYFDKKSYKSIMESTKGEFSGIGISIISKSPDDDVLPIVDVIGKGPAEKAGLIPEDKIIEVEGERIKGLSTDEVINKLKGKIGTEVKVKVLRKKKSLKFKIKRDIIKDQTSLCFHFKKQGVYYLSLRTFNEVSSDQVSKILDIANEGKCKGLVLDLRRNPGGTLTSAIEVADLFLEKESTVVMTKDNKGKVLETYKTKNNPTLKNNVPIFILVDNFSASASEILAGALRCHSINEKTNNKLMVFLIGTPTFGKGSVQELIPLKNGAALKLTVSLYYLPDDTCIQPEGITPDFIINPKIIPEKEMKWINEFYGKETALKNHITKNEVEGKGEDEGKNGKKGKSKNKSFWSRIFGSGQSETKKKVSAPDDEDDEESKKNWEKQQIDNLVKDPQVQTSVNMICLLDVAKKNSPKLVKTRKKALEFLNKNFASDDLKDVEKISG